MLPQSSDLSSPIDIDQWNDSRLSLDSRCWTAIFHSSLDALFTHILSSVADICLVLEVLSLLLTVLGMSTSSHIEELMSCGQGEIQLLLIDLHSIIWVLESDTDEIQILHASFRDYLLDRSRSGPFFIDLSEAYAKLAVKYIHHINMHQCTLFLCFHDK